MLLTSMTSVAKIEQHQNEKHENKNKNQYKDREGLEMEMGKGFGNGERFQGMQRVPSKKRQLAMGQYTSPLKRLWKLI